MQIDARDWIGNWENFELWIDTQTPELERTWHEVEAAVAEMPPRAKAMFGDDPRSFWRRACSTATPESPTRLGGWHITAAGNPEVELDIEWLAEDGSSLGRGTYALDRIVERGLEGKPNVLLHGHGNDLPAAYSWLLAMEPMPERGARDRGGLLAHTHFQFGSSQEAIVTADGALANPRWYPTMCDAAREDGERIRVIRALHHLSEANGHGVNA